jgi:hypothetical protein
MILGLDEASRGVRKTREGFVLTEMFVNIHAAVV